MAIMWHFLSPECDYVCGLRAGLYFRIEIHFYICDAKMFFWGISMVHRDKETNSYAVHQEDNSVLCISNVRPVNLPSGKH